MIKRILIFLIPIVVLFAYGLKPKDKPTRNNGNNNGNHQPYRIMSNPNQVFAVDSKQMNSNQINTWFRTNGSFNRDPTTGNAGFEWPKGQARFARYASGIWIGAIVNGDTLICVAEYDYEYEPGFVNSSGQPEGRDDANFRLYNITTTDTTDYPAWRTIASQQGAYLDSNGNPLLLGAQTQFYSYTDGYPDAHGNNAGSTAPLKAQILQTNWAYAVSGPLSNMTFTEFRIINRSSDVWTNCYIALWTDDDLGDANDDAVGVDTNINLGFTYNFDNNDAQYGTAPPACGFDYFRGPIIPSPGDTVRYYSPPGTNNEVVKVGYKQLGVTAFNMYSNGDPSIGDPSNYIETYYNLRGKRRDGTPWVTPQGDTTTFAFTGDPTSQTGWLQSEGKDRRFMQCCGPLSFGPNDTQYIVVGQVIARDRSNLLSVQALKRSDNVAQKIFDNNFKVPDAARCPVTSSYAPGNGKIYLSWNDTCEKITIPNKLSLGTYKFQGYNIYQIKSGTNGSNAGDRQLIATYDLKDGIMDIRDTVFLEEYGIYAVIVTQKGYDNGISRYIVLDRDYLNNTFISSGTPYSFSVTSYYYDSLGGPSSAPAVNESPVNNCILTITPQTLTSGTQSSYGVGDTIKMTSARDLGVMPIVIEPLNLINATFESVYGGTNNNPNWTLNRTINGSTSTLYQNVADFYGEQDTAKIVNGFLLVHQRQLDSGIVRDPEQSPNDTTRKGFYTNTKAWSYYPEGNVWFTGPDTNAVKLVTNGGGKQFDSRSLGMGFPSQNTYNGGFRNVKTRIFANGTGFRSVSATNTMTTGGPLRRIKIVFGTPQKAYRFLPDTSNAYNTPYADMVDVPFSVYAYDELDSSWDSGPRQLNVGFVDSNRNSQWDPNGSVLGGSHYTYIFASNYDPNPSTNYTNKNPGLAAPTIGLPSMDVMYVWLPRKKTVGGAELSWSNGDSLIVYPYRITRPEFVLNKPVKYTWSTTGTQFNNNQLASSKLSQIKAFPNPYYGGSSLETDPFDRFIYFSHLPAKCDIFIYTLDGVLVRKIVRNTNDPNNSLEKWDLQNTDQIPIASGMYVVFIDAGAIGSTTLKIAIFSPTERIQTF